MQFKLGKIPCFVVLFMLFPAVHGNSTFITSRLVYLETTINFEPIVACLKHVAELFVANSSVVFFFDEIQYLSWADSLFKVMRKPKFVIQKECAWAAFGFYILFPEINTTYRHDFYEKIHSRSKFLLVWQNNVDEQIVMSVFEDFWFHRYINVVAMVRREESFVFYTFEPYSVDKCGSVGKPYEISRWNWKNRQFSRYQFWFPRKLRNLAGCPLKAIGNHQPPDNIMYFNGTWSASGIGSKILRIAEEYVNFTSIIIGAELNVSLDHVWYYFERETAYLLQALNSGKADVAFGWYSYANLEVKNIEATMEFGRVSSIDCFGWAVPYRAGNKPPNYSYYVYEFKTVSWSLIIIILGISSLLFYLASGREFVLSTLIVFQTFLEQPISTPRTNNESVSFKILFTSFCFYSLVISAAYKASFSSFLSVPNQGREFQSVKDILNSSLQIKGSPLMFKIINKSAGHTSMGKSVLQRFEILEPCDYNQIMTRLVRERNLALLSVKRKMYYYSIHEAKRIKVKIPFRFIPGCLVRPHTTHFMFKRGSHLIEPFNVVLNRLFESGIITYWILHLGTNRVLPIERLKGRTLKLFFLKEPLIMLLTGYVFGGLVLICEILVHKRGNRKIEHSFVNKNK